MVLYRHINNRDVAIRIIKKFYVKETDTFKLRVEWWNVVHEPTCMNIKQNISIPASKMSEWKYYGPK